MEGKPDKVPNSGYSLYSRELLASQMIKHVETRERMTEISTQWKSLTDEERQKYNDRAQEVLSGGKQKAGSF
jgi:upstream-binding transcription factor